MRALAALPLVLAAAVASAAPSSVLLDRPVAGVFAGAPEQAARAAIARIAPSLGLGARDTLVFESAKKLPTGGHAVRFKQQHAGLDVLDAVVIVRLDGQGRVLRVASSAAPIGDVSTTARLTKAEAIRAARARLKGVVLPGDARGAGRLAIAPGAGGTLAWFVSVETALPIHAFVAVVDARSGEVLELRDLAKHAGVGKVFPSGKVAFEARQQDGSFDASKTAEVNLADLTATTEGALLTSAEVVGYNCCPNENCDAAKPAKKLALSIPIDDPRNPGQQIDLRGNIAMCHELPVAKADANGDFRFAPAQEPTSGDAPVPGPSDGDAFAEVMAYHYAHEALAFMRSLDADFALRPQARPLRVTTNFLLPNFREAIDNFDFLSFSTYSNTLIRIDNAAYIPAGSTEDLTGGVAIPELDRPFDSIVLFQGTRTDFAYDADVITHEFGHGVVAATAKLADWSADHWGVVDAPGAMNEAFSDYFAAARENDAKIGEYVGDLSGEGEGTLRDLENGFSCPSVIHGEVHVDSQHFSAALWAARQAVGTGADERLAFDRAVLASLSTITPISSFDEAAAAIAGEVRLALGDGAKAALENAFDTRDVVGCERVVDLGAQAPFELLVIAPANAARGWSNYAPAPVQFRLRPPAGATSARIAAKGGAGGGGGMDLPFGGFGGNDIDLQAQLKADAPIGYSYGAGGVASDGVETKLFVAGDPDPDTVFQLDGACGDEVFYLSLQNTGRSPWNAQEIRLEYNVDDAKAAACSPPDAGGPDAGSDAGHGHGGGGDAPEGCGCGSAGSFAVFALAGLVGALRRRR